MRSPKANRPKYGVEGGVSQNKETRQKKGKKKKKKANSPKGEKQKVNTNPLGPKLIRIRMLCIQYVPRAKKGPLTVRGNWSLGTLLEVSHWLSRRPLVDLDTIRAIQGFQSSIHGILSTEYEE